MSVANGKVTGSFERENMLNIDIIVVLILYYNACGAKNIVSDMPVCIALPVSALIKNPPTMAIIWR